jgi:hypothetical protein
MTLALSLFATCAVVALICLAVRVDSIERGPSHSVPPDRDTWEDIPLSDLGAVVEESTLPSEPTNPKPPEAA